MREKEGAVNLLAQPSKVRILVSPNKFFSIETLSAVKRVE
jgi:hypothetical protein